MRSFLNFDQDLVKPMRGWQRISSSSDHWDDRVKFAIGCNNYALEEVNEQEEHCWWLMSDNQELDDILHQVGESFLTVEAAMQAMDVYLEKFERIKAFL
jgi:hypothetical protein